MFGRILPPVMKKTFRLKSRFDFQAVYTKGRSVANKAAVLYTMSQKNLGNIGHPKIGFAAGRKLGGAVVRNRVRRRIKAAVQPLWPRVKPDVFLVLVARQAALSMPFTELQIKISELFERAAVLRMEG